MHKYYDSLFFCKKKIIIQNMFEDFSLNIGNFDLRKHELYT